MADLIGKHYVLLNSDLRPGGLSTVRKGVDTRDGSQVAVKFIFAASDELTRKVFERETSTLRSLSHPNIVGLRDSGIDDSETYYIVLDWVDRNLKDLLEDRPWDGWDDLYETIGRPLVEGLAYAHLKQIEHRDIKPGNILIDESGVPLLADFGIAKLHGEEQHSELTVQNFRSGLYAPPELNAALPYVRDVYSMGVVLLQCLSRTTIHDFPQVREALESVNVPPDVRTLLEACISIDPTERPANGSELASELAGIQRRQVAKREQPRNPVWLDLTRTAQEHLAGEPVDRSRAAVKLQEDLAGEVFAEYGRDHKTGKRDRGVLFLAGADRRYTLRPADGSPRFTVTAAAAAEFEVLERTRRHGFPLPPIFSWVVHQPVNPAPSERAQQALFELLDEFYERKEHPEAELADQDGDELFDLWLRVLEAREDLARWP